MSGGFEHQPVMVEEVVTLLREVPAGLVVDATVGGGGHAAALLSARSDLWVLGIDRDGEARAAARARLSPFGDRAQVRDGTLERLGGALAGHEEDQVMGVLMDLGVSSPQIDRPERGFSYRVDAPLDMRMDATQELTAHEVVNDYPVDRLAAIIRDHGEERYASRIARAIVAARPVTGTRELVDCVRSAIPAAARRRGGHPAKRTFQAIRMEVNRELEHLDAALDESVHLVGPGGRILVLAYHSLEDRMVKQRFAEWSATEEPGSERLPVARPRQPLVRTLTRRPIRPSAREVAANPRAESARLRAVERLAAPRP